MDTKSIILTLLLFSLIIPTVSATDSITCYYDGEPVPCDANFTSSLFTGLLVALPIIAIWLWMLIDCMKRDFKDKAWWVIIFFILGVFGAILYFFLVRKNPNKADGQLKKPMIFWIAVFFAMFVVWWIMGAIFRMVM